ncbi:MAG: hypothetical protein ACYCOR_10610 [Acidobacteriaceae bacterium]
MEGEQLNAAMRDLCEFMWVDVENEKDCTTVVENASAIFDCRATSIGGGRWHIEVREKQIHLS